MRKNIGVILIITSVLLLCGCLLDVGKQVYSSKSVSSLTTGSSINKSSILLIGDMSSFGENRLVEEKLKEKYEVLLFEKIPIDPDEIIALEMLSARKEGR